MLLHAAGAPLVPSEVDRPLPRPGELLLEVRACGVCRTDLHIVDGELVHPKLPLIPGHQIVGLTEDGRRMGVPWLGWTCGVCRYCRSGRENLCDRARFTGYDLDGGYAEFTIADERFCFPLPDGYGDLEIAPLLCAGLIGYRSLRMTGDAERLGLYGFGSAAHIVAQVARWQGRRLFAVTREGDEEAQSFARSLGVEWAGAGTPPEELDAAIIFAPAGELVPAALKALGKGGTVVCAGIHMSDIPAFPYEILWGERSDPVGRKPDPQPRRGVPRARAAGAGGYRGRGVPARAGERGSFEAALRQRPRITRPRPIARPVDVINLRPGRIRPRPPRRAPTGLRRAVPSAPGRASRTRSRGRAGRRIRSMPGRRRAPRRFPSWRTGCSRAATLDGDPHQLADTGRVEGLERIVCEDPLIEVVGEERPFRVVA